jgi:hypothetical protein
MNEQRAEQHSRREARSKQRAHRGKTRAEVRNEAKAKGQPGSGQADDTATYTDPEQQRGPSHDPPLPEDFEGVSDEKVEEEFTEEDRHLGRFGAGNGNVNRGDIGVG